MCTLNDTEYWSKGYVRYQNLRQTLSVLRVDAFGEVREVVGHRPRWKYISLGTYTKQTLVVVRNATEYMKNSQYKTAVTTVKEFLVSSLFALACAT